MDISAFVPFVLTNILYEQNIIYCIVINSRAMYRNNLKICRLLCFYRTNGIIIIRIGQSFG